MKRLLLPANAVFSASNKTITFSSTIPAAIGSILHIVNITRGVIYFQPQAGEGYTGVYAAPVLTLAASTVGHSDSDELAIFWEDGIEPALESGGHLESIADKDFATQATLASVLAKLSGDPATQATLAAVLAKLGTTLAVSGSMTANAGTNLNTSALALESGGNLQSLAGKDFATQTTLASVLAELVLILAKMPSAPALEGGNLAALAGKDFATQTTLASVLAKLSGDPATETTLDAILTKILASIAVTGTFWPETQPVSGTVAISSMPSDDPGQKPMASSDSVVIASDQSPVPTTAANTEAALATANAVLAGINVDTDNLTKLQEVVETMERCAYMLGKLCATIGMTNVDPAGRLNVALTSIPNMATLTTLTTCSTVTTCNTVSALTNLVSIGGLAANLDQYAAGCAGAWANRNKITTN